MTPTYCDLCGEELKPFEISQVVREVSALDICTCCLEGMLDATAINPRSEVGLVGSCDGRS